MLIDILTYHVVAGNAHSSTLVPGPVKTLNGDFVRIRTNPNVTINGAKVTGADILASNGIIHVINEVLLPPEKKDPINSSSKSGKSESSESSKSKAGKSKSAKKRWGSVIGLFDGGVLIDEMYAC